jgi:lipoate synthase
MLRVEARNAETPIEKKPEWIRTRATMGPAYTELTGIVKTGGEPSSWHVRRRLEVVRQPDG